MPQANYQERLSCRLDYRFKDDALLTMALSHRSVGYPNNERLEFLGDAILSYVIAENLLQRFPFAKEGELTRLRANVVREETLADVGKSLELGQFLLLGSGELKNGGWRRPSIIGDAVEALIGAIYLDSGIDNCKKVILQLFEKPLGAISPVNIQKDPKTQLQEYLQSQRQSLPVYRVLTVEGSAHEQLFSVECEVPGLDKPAHGEGKSRRYAEQAAAKKALFLLKKSP